MCECDYDLPEYFRQANVRARKMHMCTECRGWITARDGLDGPKVHPRFEAD